MAVKMKKKIFFVQNICKVVVQEYISPLITQYIVAFFLVFVKHPIIDKIHQTS